MTDPAAHLDACAECRALVTDLRQNAALAATAIRRLAPANVSSPAAAALALERLHGSGQAAPAAPAPVRGVQTATPMPSGATETAAAPAALPVHGRDKHQEKRSMTLALPFQRWRVAMSGLAAALLLMAVVGTPQGRGAAAQMLAQFRGDRFVAVPLSTGQVANIEATLSELERLGAVQGLDTAPEMRTVASIAEASEFVGFPVQQPDAAALPAGVSSTPTAIRVLPAHELRFTFDREKARAYYQSIGRGSLSLPERFHGASIVVNTPPGVLLEYRGAGQSADESSTFGLVIGQAGVLTAGTEGGVTLDEVREFFVDLPGLSRETARQLRAINDWQTTLPIPIPAEQIAWQRATIAGSSGLLLNDNTGLGSAAIWQRDGRIYGIVGAVKAREIQRVAETLR